MAFIDRIVEYPGRYTLTNVDTGTVLGTFDLVRAEGDVYTDGTLLNANNLNIQTQVDSTVETLFETAGMTGGTYQNNMSDALNFLLENMNPEIKTNGSWRYVTMGNLFMGWINFNGTLTIQTATGSIYTSASASSITFPSGVLSQAIYADVKAYTNNYPILTALRSLSASGLTYQPISSLSRASATYTIEAFVMGITA